MIENNWIVFGSVLVITFCLSLFNSVDSLKVSVYYESLCFDSARFVVHQLYPNWKELDPYVDLELIPYGKALHNYRDGKYDFFCQHGPSECEGNKLQACLFSQHRKLSHRDVKLLHCIMTSRNSSSFDTAKDCAIEHGYNAKSLKRCMRGNKADLLLAKYGNQTWDLVPRLSFVPTIVYDDQYNKKDQDNSLTDFAAVVCSKIIQLNKPAICEDKILPTEKND